MSCAPCEARQATLLAWGNGHWPWLLGALLAIPILLWLPRLSRRPT